MPAFESVEDLWPLVMGDGVEFPVLSDTELRDLRTKSKERLQGAVKSFLRPAMNIDLNRAFPSLSSVQGEQKHSRSRKQEREFQNNLPKDLLKVGTRDERETLMQTLEDRVVGFSDYSAEYKAHMMSLYARRVQGYGNKSLEPPSDGKAAFLPDPYRTNEDRNKFVQMFLRVVNHEGKRVTVVLRSLTQFLFKMILLFRGWTVRMLQLVARTKRRRD